MRRVSAVLVAIAAGLALADASIVALALPPILTELGTTIEGVAAVIGVYTLVLAVGIVPAAWLARRIGAGHTGALGLLLFAGASAGCAASDSLTALLIFRALQAAGGAAALLAAFDLLDAGGEERTLGRRLWIAAAVFGTAAGPAVGGVLTELLDWRAVFVAQVPFSLVAAVACWGLREPVPVDRPTAPWRWGPAVALALVAAALTAVLFLLVLEMVAGWNIEPLAAAAAMTVLPLAAIAASRIGGDARTRACAGSLLVAGGAAALAFLPDADVWWTVPAQAVAGAGMGLALPALSGGLLPERSAGDAARLLIARHVGIVAALLVLAPVVSGRLDDITEQATLQGTALVLDAKLDPRDKIDLAPALMASTDTEEPRSSFKRAVERERGRFEGEDLVAFDQLTERTDDTLVAAVADAFRPAYLITGAIALAAGLILLPRARPGWVAAGAAAGAAAFGGYVVADRELAPPEVQIASPCLPRDLPDSGGITGLLQDSALILVDRAACKYGSSREELVLALADDDWRRTYEARYDVDPRSVEGILGGLFG